MGGTEHSFAKHDRTRGTRTAAMQRQIAERMRGAAGMAGYLLHLQRTIGNQAVGQWLRRQGLRPPQPEAGAPYESPAVEAEANADPAANAAPGGAEIRIQRVIESTKEGKGSRARTMYYSTEDPGIVPRLFPTEAEAKEYEKSLLAKKGTPTTASVGGTGGATATLAPSKPVTATPKLTASEPGGTAPSKATAIPLVTATPSPTVSVPVPSVPKGPSAPTTPVPSTIPALSTTAPVTVPSVSGPAPTSAKTVSGKAPNLPLSKVTDEAWERAWLAKQAEVNEAMQAFVPRFVALDPAAEVRIRGSLATGVKMNPSKADPTTGERLLFNPTDFDIDAYVVSNKLFAQATKSDPAAAARGQIAGSKLSSVNAIIREMRGALAGITGNRDAPKESQFRFNVLIRSAGNAAKTVGKDQAEMRKLGKPEGWGNPMVIQPPKKT